MKTSRKKIEQRIAFVKQTLNIFVDDRRNDYAIEYFKGMHDTLLDISEGVYSKDIKYTLETVMDG